MEKTIGELVDELSVTNIRIWMLEDICRNNCNMEKVGEAKIKINAANQLRNDLKDAINKAVGKETGFGSTKLYGKQ